MGKKPVTDELWKIIEPLLPPETPKPKGGGPGSPTGRHSPVSSSSSRAAFPGRCCPREMGCGSGSTCWRRLRDWQEAGVWRELHRVLLDRLGEADQMDWEHASLDLASVAAKRGRADRPEPDG
jgi:transposase